MRILVRPQQAAGEFYPTASPETVRRIELLRTLPCDQWNNHDIALRRQYECGYEDAWRKRNELVKTKKFTHCEQRPGWVIEERGASEPWQGYVLAWPDWWQPFDIDELGCVDGMEKPVIFHRRTSALEAVKEIRIEYDPMAHLRAGMPRIPESENTLPREVREELGLVPTAADYEPPTQEARVIHFAAGTCFEIDGPADTVRMIGTGEPVVER